MHVHKPRLDLLEQHSGSF